VAREALSPAFLGQEHLVALQELGVAGLGERELVLGVFAGVWHG
jgi:hypothetical protein